MSFWTIDSLAITDRVNDSIWLNSPDLQRSLQPPRTLVAPGAIGAQQAMLPALPDGILPWVPDFLGTRWQESEGVIVVGSAYAGVIRECSSRGQSMPLADYVNAQTWQGFQRVFVRWVMAGDLNYYGPIATLLAEAGATAETAALLDLCRVSFVQRGSGENDRRDKSGDAVVLRSPPTYASYAEHPRAQAWTWERLVGTRATRVVALGTIAEHGILRLFGSKGCTITHSRARVSCRPRPLEGGAWVSRYMDTRWKLSHWITEHAWWEVEGAVEGVRRQWRILPIVHPARCQRSDLERGGHLLRAMLE